MRERQTETETERHRETQRDTERQTHTQRHREREYHVFYLLGASHAQTPLTVY